MRANIDRTLSIRISRIKGRANALFPGENTADISPQVLIAHRSEIAFAQVTPLNSLTICSKNPLKLIGLPWINDCGRSIWFLTENQAVNRNVAEIQLIICWIKVSDVLRKIADLNASHGFMLLKAPSSLTRSQIRSTLQSKGWWPHPDAPCVMDVTICLHPRKIRLHPLRKESIQISQLQPCFWIPKALSRHKR